MDKNKKDYLSVALLYQFLVCSLLFGILFGMNYMKMDFIKSVKAEFFDKIQSNEIIEIIDNKTKTVSNENKEKEPQVSSNKNINSNESTVEVIENQSQDALIANVSATGGNDTEIKNSSDIPENVSVSSYTLNQRMYLPLDGTVTSEFGARIHPIKGNLSYHSGIDIAAPMGEPIKAAFDGVVVESEYDKWNGYHIKIQHDNGVMTVYCHCNELFVDCGTTVDAGDKIATVGSTGSSTGPHLHFEFRINDICYNPEPALNEAVNAV